MRATVGSGTGAHVAPEAQRKGTPLSLGVQIRGALQEVAAGKMHLEREVGVSSEDMAKPRGR